MTGRIVLFGATGFTGRLVATALVRRGARRLLLAGRNGARLADLADELDRARDSAEEGGREAAQEGGPAGALDGGSGSGGAVDRPGTAVLDVDDPAGWAGLQLGPDDVLVTTVGPYARLGEPAVRAAVEAGAAYLDCTGEPAFLREVFQRHGPAAVARGAALLPAFGYDYVPGNLAAALALRDARDAGAPAVRVEVGYFLTGGGFAASGGTSASGAGMLFTPSFAWRDGRLVDERLAARLRVFAAGGASSEADGATAPGPALSFGGSEHLVLPRLTELAPDLRDVGVYVGWAGRYSRAAQLGVAALQAGTVLPGGRRGLAKAAQRLRPGSTGGPDAARRATARSQVVAEAYDRRGTQVARVELVGPNAYDLTGELLAWGALAARAGHLRGTGALGPVDGFGLERLAQGCAEVGLVPTGTAPPPS